MNANNNSVEAGIFKGARRHVHAFLKFNQESTYYVWSIFNTTVGHLYLFIMDIIGNFSDTLWDPGATLSMKEVCQVLASSVEKVD